MSTKRCDLDSKSSFNRQPRKMRVRVREGRRGGETRLSGRTGRRTDGRTGRRTDGQTDKRTNELVIQPASCDAHLCLLELQCCVGGLGDDEIPPTTRFSTGGERRQTRPCERYLHDLQIDFATDVIDYRHSFCAPPGFRFGKAQLTQLLARHQPPLHAALQILSCLPTAPLRYHNAI